jgi:NurA-like 5'-3' nuclease
MNPQKGDEVKLLFRNNLEIEGVVQTWSNEKSIIKCANNDNFYIIQKTAEDIVVVLVVKTPTPEKIKEELQTDFEQTYNQPSNENLQPEDLRIQNLASLRKLLIKQDKKIVEDKLKTHSSTPFSYGVKYGVPGFLEIKSPK